ncbi:toxin-antitoxin system YwqK family antitoxin [Corallococcus silvisoli]|uniref:toxin-antitoxin system YwqK family antitoxin n=1 Tax=Corallococcus silvisoli TaxID=2697031 RepID=UPI0013783FCE|nr:hypothetical protein [Corallococcus silvisoli]NBD12247.1 hypothetical protein [Corallococcus silvisoli]
MPRLLEAWVLGPGSWGAPPRAGGLVLSLVPWVSWGLFLAVLVHALRGRGAVPAPRREALGAGLVAGLLPVGLPRLAGVLASVPGARARALKMGAVGVVLLQGVVALLLVAEFQTLAPRWGLAVLCADAVLLCVQGGFLRAALWTLHDAGGEGVGAAAEAEPISAPAVEVARQEAGYDCPECLVVTPLFWTEGRMGAHCDLCGGDLLSARDQAQVLTERGLGADSLRRTLEEPGGRPAKCASCGGACATVVFQGVAVVPCSACGTLWMREGVLHVLSRGRHGRPRTPSRVGAPRPPALPVSWGAPGWIAALGLAAGGLVLARSGLETCPPGAAVRREPMPGGHVLSQCVVGAGTREGTSWLRTDRGRLLQAEAFTQGRRDGAWSRWDREGRLHAEGAYAAGVPEGEWRTLDETGAVVFRAHFLKGRLEGVAEDVSPDGRVLEQRTYAAGQLHGPYKHFFANGTAHVEGAYAHGLRDGQWSTHDAQGKRLDLSWWMAGRPTLMGEGSRPVGQGDTRLEDGATSAEEREARWESAADMAMVKRALAAKGVSATPVEEALYGGHPQEWWAQRLRLVWPRRDTQEGAARYALTVKRAGLHGLRVEETVAGPRVSLERTASPPAPGADAQASKEAP